MTTAISTRVNPRGPRGDRVMVSVSPIRWGAPPVTGPAERAWYRQVHASPGETQDRDHGAICPERRGKVHAGARGTPSFAGALARGVQAAAPAPAPRGRPLRYLRERALQCARPERGRARDC